jgi:hypothetical protein
MAANMQQFIEGIGIMVFLRGMPFFADLVGREPERRRKIITAWPIMKMTLCCQNAAVHRRHWNHGIFTRNAFILGTNSDFCRQKDRNVNLTWNRRRHTDISSARQIDWRRKAARRWVMSMKTGCVDKTLEGISDASFHQVRLCHAGVRRRPRRSWKWTFNAAEADHMPYWRGFIMKHTTMTAVRGGAGLGVLAAMLFASGAYAQNVGSSALNVGGQDNGKQSVSGVGNDQNVTGNNSTGIYNNAASNANGNSLKNSGNSKATSSGNKSNQALTINSTTPSSQTLYTVPNVYAPGLAAAGAEVCLGSVSAGGSGAGFGVSIGGTYVDTECQLRLNARTLATLGYTVAAREEMCLDPQVRAAMLAAGSPCAADMGAHAAPYNAMSSQSSYSPPPIQEASAQGCERRYQLFGGWYEVCK